MPLIAACLGFMFGVGDTSALKVVVISMVTAVIAISVWVGLEKGIKRLSNPAVWLALGPFMGIFITKISGGRTLRQVILGSLGYGTLGTSLFFIVLGYYAMHLELSGQLQVLDSMNDDGAAQAVVDVIASLSLAALLVPLFCLICVIFAATSYDSASYTLASSTTRALPRNAHPARWNRVLWAVALGLLPITLIQIGGLRPLPVAMPSRYPP